MTGDRTAESVGANDPLCQIDTYDYATITSATEILIQNPSLTDQIHRIYGQGISDDITMLSNARWDTSQYLSVGRERMTRGKSYD